MILEIFENDDEEQVIAADQEGIDYLRRGLDQLEGAEPGDELTTPTLTQDGDTGEPAGVSQLVLLRRGDDLKQRAPGEGRV